MTFTLRGARLIDAVADLPAGDLVVAGGTITSVGEAPGEAPGETLDAVSGSGTATPGGRHGNSQGNSQGNSHGSIIDASGMIVAPGFIDLHTHGGGSYNLHTTDPEEICAYARWVPSTGVTSFLIAVVGVPHDLPLPQMRAAAQAVATCAAGTGAAAEPLGIHLEGPYISEKRRGAHPREWLRTPSDEETALLLEAAGGTLRLVTLAPELPGAAVMIRQLVASGVTVSIGHTDATYEQTRAAIALGATQATHCCNAMRPLHHRDPGPLGAVAAARTVRGEVIADGFHVHPAMVRLLVRLLGTERTVLVTDALAGAGLEEATFEFAGQQARVSGGVARLADGTITGSVLTMDRALRNVLPMAGVSLQEGIGMLTFNPARAIGLGERKGRLAPGYDADLVLLDQALRVQATICCGRVTYATKAWASRLRAVGTPTPAHQRT